MRCLPPLGLFLFAFSALCARAEPRVGTYVVYEVERVFQGEPAKYLQRRELVAFDADRKVFRETMTVEKPGEAPIVNEGEVRLDYLLAKEQELARLLQNCRGSGKRLVEIEVPAGTFQACEVVSKNNQMDSTTWHAKVPLEGMARETVDAEIVRHQRTLVDYHF